ncbi:type II secretion system protein [Trinickia mobilis]|uniref:type II secretion system protein n=1 Tax=Trinickia mobilis TaxID=2816356 RepID=UPI001A8ED8FE|nr:type II secretion system GspH family protein [Trinickia mobilis]
MRPGKRAAPAGRQRGVAYMGVVLLIAAIGVGMMEAAHVWSVQAQREREKELLTVGNEIRDAIGSYYRSGEGAAYPKSLDDLVVDRRTSFPTHHLRKHYRDPLTGDREWGVVESPDGGLMGVFSKAQGTPVKRGGFPAAYESFGDKETYQEWTFVYLPDNAAPAEGGDTPSFEAQEAQ